MGDTSKLGLAGALISAMALLLPGCAHERAAGPPPSSIGGAAQAGQPEDVDHAATEPPPGEEEETLPQPRTHTVPGTGGSGPVQPPPLVEEQLEPIPDTSAPAPSTPHTRQQLEGDKVPSTLSNQEQLAPVGGEKQE